MPRKPKRKNLIKKLDAVFSKYIRLRDADTEGYCRCSTCGEVHHWTKIQAGHFISRKHYATRWNEENVHAQCVACNVFRYGEQYKFSLYLGDKLSKELLEKSRLIAKFTDIEIKEMIDDYNDRIKQFSFHS
jgi:5-methylcytosine-specific restriction endonuclease McrA